MVVVRLQCGYQFPTCLTLIASLIYAGVDGVGKCRPPETVELQIGTTGTIICICENSIDLFWYYGNAESGRDLFIYIENSQKQGSGYTSGEYDIAENGSLIIFNVSQLHERNYTVVIREPGNTRTVKEHFTVNVYALPHLRHPVVNNQFERYVVSNGDRRGNLTCHLKGVMPLASLMWEILTPVSGKALILQNETHVTEKKDGTFDVSLISHYSIIDNTVETLVMQCIVPEIIFNDRLSSTILTLILPKVPSTPVVSGCPTHNDLCFLEGKRSGELICKVEETSLEGYLSWRIGERFLAKSIKLHVNESISQNYLAIASYVVEDSLLSVVTFQCVMRADRDIDHTVSVITVELSLIEDDTVSEFMLTGLNELRRLENWNLSMTILLLAVVTLLLGEKARKLVRQRSKKSLNDGEVDGCSKEQCWPLRSS